jgi:hypothetical protein
MSKQSTVKLRVLTAKKSAENKMEQRSKGLNEETLQKLSHDLGERVIQGANAWMKL